MKDIDQSAAPDWLSAAAHQTLDELRLFLRTAISFSLRPRRFAEQWTRGEQDALNPLGFVATAAAIIAPVRILFGRWRGDVDSDSLLFQLLTTLAPFLHFIFLGIVCHFVLRLFGSRRRVRDSVAIALFAGGGPAIICELFLTACIVGISHLNGAEHGFDTSTIHSRSLATLVGAVLVVPVFGFVYALIGGLRGLHHASWWQALLSFVAAWLVSGLVFGFLHLPGHAWGLHWVIEFGRANGHFELKSFLLTF